MNSFSDFLTRKVKRQRPGMTPPGGAPSPFASPLAAPQMQPMDLPPLGMKQNPDDLQSDVAAGNPGTPVGYAYRDLLRGPGPAPELTHHTGGFKSRLKDALVGLAATGNPLVALAGLAYPQGIHQLRHETIDMPRYKEDAMFKSKMQNDQLGRAMKIADVTGTDPLTGEPTREAQQAQAMMDYRKSMEDYRMDSLDLRRQLGEQSNAIRMLSAQNTQDNRMVSQARQRGNLILRSYTSGQVLTAADRAALVEAGIPGADQLPDKYDPQYAQIAYDAAGNALSVTTSRLGRGTPATPQVTPVPGAVRPAPQTAPPSEMEVDKHARQVVEDEYKAKGKIRTATAQERRQKELGIIDTLPEDTYSQEEFEQRVREVKEQMKREGVTAAPRQQSTGPVQGQGFQRLPNGKIRIFIKR